MAFEALMPNCRLWQVCGCHKYDVRWWQSLKSKPLYKPKGSFTPDATRCGVVQCRAAPHVDAFTPDALPYALHCIALPHGDVRSPCTTIYIYTLLIPSYVDKPIVYCMTGRMRDIIKSQRMTVVCFWRLKSVRSETLLLGGAKVSP